LENCEASIFTSSLAKYRAPVLNDSEPSMETSLEFSTEVKTEAIATN
jgi:hypothetical protein